MRFLLFLCLASYVFAEPIHSSITTYYENLEFKNSKRKTDRTVLGFGGDIHVDNSEYRFVYEHTDTNTFQPPLQDDLHVDKLFLRYGYDFKNGLHANINYINVLHDNIVPTAHGQSYGAGLGYDITPKLSANFTQFYTDYKDFDVHQSDIKFDYKTQLDNIKMKFTSITQVIHLQDYETNPLSKNADEDYISTGLKFHGHYESYHLGAAAYYGKRLFAIMDDGFKLQHHAMEFDRTYAVGFGKSFTPSWIARVQYVFQRAEEIPYYNKNVEVENLKLILNYKF
ncbi:MAG: hypothetical protein PHU40_12795 [Sulfurimonas sp.]|nr:hypothetical protein [Sulfurimonas sp.]